MTVVRRQMIEATMLLNGIGSAKASGQMPTAVTTYQSASDPGNQEGESTRRVLSRPRAIFGRPRDSVGRCINLSKTSWQSKC